MAVIGNRTAGIVASASAALWFDFFLTRPYDRFAISHRPDLETTIAHLRGRGARDRTRRRAADDHWQAANSSTAYVAMIHSVAELAADSAPVDGDDRPDDRRSRRGYSRCAPVASTERSPNPPLAQIQSERRGRARGNALAGPRDRPPRSRGRDRGAVARSSRRAIRPDADAGAPVSLEQRIVAVAVVDVFAAYLVGECMRRKLSGRSGGD